MAMFFVLAAAMIAAALAFVLVPLLRARGTAADGHARRLRALDDALAAGVIERDEYAAKRAAIEASPPAAPAAGRSRAAGATIIVVALLLPASALLLYRVVGTPEALDPTRLASAETAHGDTGPAMEQAIATLAQRLKEHPDDVEGWALLGRAYGATGHLAEARDAWKRARELAPDNAAVTVEYAQALAVAADDRRIAGEARTLLESVLASDPRNQRALWLLGISDYQTGRYDAAIARWRALQPLLPPDSEVARSVGAQIADAEAKRDGKPSPAVAEAAQDTPAAAPGAGVAATSPKLTVNASLAPALKDKLDPDATLFVFARAAGGPPMPLAIRRLKASELPVTVTLDDSLAMMPSMKLSSFPQVVLGARVSKSGNAMPQSGDLQAVSAPIDVHRSEPVELTIDSIVP